MSTMLKKLKQLNDGLLYKYFRRHHRSRMAQEFRPPSRIRKAQPRSTVSKENILRERGRVLNNPEEALSDKLVSIVKKKREWSWDAKLLDSRRAVLSHVSN